MREVYIEGHERPVQYFDYSELTYIEKVSAAYSACMLFSEDLTRGLWKECQNDEWYGKLLMLLKDLKYDVSSVEHIDWNNASQYEQFFYKIGYELCDILHSDQYRNAKRRRGLILNRIIV